MFGLFHYREPHKFAKKILEEKRALLIAEMGPHVVPNGSFIESTSRPPTPPEGTIEAETGICLTPAVCKTYRKEYFWQVPKRKRRAKNGKNVKVTNEL